jgi:hypothetical protein
MKNLLTEKQYLELTISELYNEIASYGENEIGVVPLMESILKEEKGKTIIQDIVEDLKLAPKFIFTFGTGVTAFYEPLSKLLDGSGLQLDDYNIYLLIITAIAGILNETDYNKLVEALREKGLLPMLGHVKEFILNTEKLLKEVVKKSLGATYSLLDILGFTSLLVPSMSIISKVILENGITMNSMTSLFSGLILATIAYSAKSVIKKIKNKLS